MTLLEPRLQLPAARVRRLVAHAVPALGHGQGRPDYQGVANRVLQTGHLPRSDEGDQRDAEGRRDPEVRAVRRHPVRCEGSGKVRQGVSRSTTCHDRQRDRPFLSAAHRDRHGRTDLAAGQSVHPRSPVPASHMGGKQALPARTVRESAARWTRVSALLASYSLVRVTQGFLLGIGLATPLGLLLGMSPTLHRMFDPVMQILRPISPLAWLPLGLVVFQKSEPAAMFAIAICSMWPTVINSAAGVRAIPQDYWNVAKVLRLSRFTTFTKIVIPATLPYIFTGYRLSLGIAWLVIVASEMLTGHTWHWRVPLAGIQQPGLRPHPPGDRHDRPDRLRARSPDGHGRDETEDCLVAFSRSRRFRKRSLPGRRSATCSIARACRSTRASSFRLSASWAAESRRS